MRIDKVNITNFGSFKNLDWDKNVRDYGNNCINFKKLNIIYGRNYAGKTTFSRIFRALETKQFPLHYENVDFSIQGDCGEVVSNAISSHSYNVRVYNQDFVKDNLSFLTNQIDGEIQTFAIIGDKNNEIESEIQKLKEELGDKQQSGLYFQEEKLTSQKIQDQERYNQAKTELDNSLKRKAKEIKENPEYFREITYDITKLKNDILQILQQELQPLSDSEIDLKKTILNQTALPEISIRSIPILNIQIYLEQANKLLTRQIKPTKAIDELLHNSLLQQWVHKGIDLHRNNRETCAFCFQTLPNDIWQRLDAHFSQESANLEKEINACIQSISQEFQRIQGAKLPEISSFYSDKHDEFQKIQSNIVNFWNEYQNSLNIICQKLQKRLDNIFQHEDTIIEMNISKSDLVSYFSQLNNLITEHNNKTNGLDEEKAKIRSELKFSYIAKFIKEINYLKLDKDIKDLKDKCEITDEKLKDLKIKIQDIYSQIETLMSQMHDEKKGAEQINQLLQQFFKHNEIKLEVFDNKGIKFKITRNGVPAYNLSEGECSLIAFCYFMAKLEDIESKEKDLIIYIDDPISSLDSNHIFFVYSLIEERLAKNKNYAQLFISTHNLDFLKYLKRLTVPMIKRENSKKKEEDLLQFLIKKKDKISNIELMPDYLKKYTTEFNYLFHEIYKCQDNSNPDSLYSFGNNLRKFLESYLFFKYPHQGKLDEKISKFFDINSSIRINRLVNEFSHLEEIFDRSILPIDIPEMNEIAKLVLQKIEEKDKEQYDSFMLSIQKEI